MSRPYLFAISFGPIQGFIAAARRTRDFWMASTILSELGKAIARWIVAQPVGEGETDKFQRLIFPAPNDESELKPWEFSIEGVPPPSDFNVTNVILCVVETSDPKKFAADAREELQAQWGQFVDFTEQAIQADLRTDTWSQQKTRKHDVFEFYTAWVPYEEGKYAEARQRVMRLLGARKTLRDFTQWNGIAGLPKSSLDAARETVLKKADERSSSLRVRDAEDLDIVGVVKRVEFGNDSIRYPSVSRYAADPWIRGVRNHPDGDQLLESIQTACGQLVRLGALRQRKEFQGRQKEDDIPKFPWLRDFPFEGTPLFVGRHEEIIRDCSRRHGESKEGLARRQQEIREYLGRLARSLRDHQEQFGAPSPYFAILAADGDRMGRTISTLAKYNDSQLHRAFSRAQSKFDEAVRKRINGQEGADIPESERFRGATVFAGADDILAFLPVDQCVRCARILHECFETILRQDLPPEVSQRLKDVDAWPTLSVGIAIGHCMEPLEDLLEYAREAEHRAKNPTPAERARQHEERDALTIAIHARSGAPFIVRDNWRRSPHQAFDERIQQWTELHLQRLIPSKAAYDLRRLSLDYENWPSGAALTMAIQRDASRVLKRKRAEGAEATQRAGAQDTLTPLLQHVQSADGLRALANELLVGQWIAAATDQANGRQNGGRAEAEEGINE